MRAALALYRNTSNIIIVKGSSYSDGDQSHQHQQNEQWPLTEHKNITTCDVGNPAPGLGQAQKCGWG